MRPSSTHFDATGRPKVEQFDAWLNSQPSELVAIFQAILSNFSVPSQFQPSAIDSLLPLPVAEKRGAIYAFFNQYQYEDDEQLTLLSDGISYAARESKDLVRIPPLSIEHQNSEMLCVILPATILNQLFLNIKKIKPQQELKFRTILNRSGHHGGMIVRFKISEALRERLLALHTHFAGDENAASGAIVQLAEKMLAAVDPNDQSLRANLQRVFGIHAAVNYLQCTRIQKDDVSCGPAALVGLRVPDQVANCVSALFADAGDGSGYNFRLLQARFSDILCSAHMAKLRGKNVEEHLKKLLMSFDPLGVKLRTHQDVANSNNRSEAKQPDAKKVDANSAAAAAPKSDGAIVADKKDAKDGSTPAAAPVPAAPKLQPLSAELQVVISSYFSNVSIEVFDSKNSFVQYQQALNDEITFRSQQSRTPTERLLQTAAASRPTPPKPASAPNSSTPSASLPAAAAVEAEVQAVLSAQEEPVQHLSLPAVINTVVHKTNPSISLSTSAATSTHTLHSKKLERDLEDRWTRALLHLGLEEKLSIPQPFYEAIKANLRHFMPYFSYQTDRVIPRVSLIGRTVEHFPYEGRAAFYAAFAIVAGYTKKEKIENFTRDCARYGEFQPLRSLGYALARKLEISEAAADFIAKQFEAQVELGHQFNESLEVIKVFVVELKKRVVPNQQLNETDFYHAFEKVEKDPACRKLFENPNNHNPHHYSAAKTYLAMYFPAIYRDPILRERWIRSYVRLTIEKRDHWSAVACAYAELQGVALYSERFQKINSAYQGIKSLNPPFDYRPLAKVLAVELELEKEGRENFVTHYVQLKTSRRLEWNDAGIIGHAVGLARASVLSAAAVDSKAPDAKAPSDSKKQQLAPLFENFHREACEIYLTYSPESVAYCVFRAEQLSKETAEALVDISAKTNLATYFPAIFHQPAAREQWLKAYIQLRVNGMEDICAMACAYAHLQGVSPHGELAKKIVFVYKDQNFTSPFNYRPLAELLAKMLEVGSARRRESFVQKYLSLKELRSAEWGDAGIIGYAFAWAKTDFDPSLSVVQRERAAQQFQTFHYEACRTYPAYSLRNLNYCSHRADGKNESASKVLVDQKLVPPTLSKKKSVRWSVPLQKTKIYFEKEEKSSSFSPKVKAWLTKHYSHNVATPAARAARPPLKPILKKNVLESKKLQPSQQQRQKSEQKLDHLVNEDNQVYQAFIQHGNLNPIIAEGLAYAADFYEEHNVALDPEAREKSAFQVGKFFAVNFANGMSRADFASLFKLVHEGMLHAYKAINLVEHRFVDLKAHPHLRNGALYRFQDTKDEKTNQFTRSELLVNSEDPNELHDCFIKMPFKEEQALSFGCAFAEAIKKGKTHAEALEYANDRLALLHRVYTLHHGDDVAIQKYLEKYNAAEIEAEAFCSERIHQKDYIELIMEGRSPIWAKAFVHAKLRKLSHLDASFAKRYADAIEYLVAESLISQNELPQDLSEPLNHVGYGCAYRVPPATAKTSVKKTKSSAELKQLTSLAEKVGTVLNFSGLLPVGRAYANARNSGRNRIWAEYYASVLGEQNSVRKQKNSESWSIVYATIMYQANRKEEQAKHVAESDRTQLIREATAYRKNASAIADMVEQSPLLKAKAPKLKENPSAVEEPLVEYWQHYFSARERGNSPEWARYYAEARCATPALSHPDAQVFAQQKVMPEHDPIAVAEAFNYARQTAIRVFGLSENQAEKYANCYCVTAFSLPVKFNQHADIPTHFIASVYAKAFFLLEEKVRLLNADASPSEVVESLPNSERQAAIFAQLFQEYLSAPYNMASIEARNQACKVFPLYLRTLKYIRCLDKFSVSPYTTAAENSHYVKYVQSIEQNPNYMQFVFSEKNHLVILSALQHAIKFNSKDSTCRARLIAFYRNPYLLKYLSKKETLPLAIQFLSFPKPVSTNEQIQGAYSQLYAAVERACHSHLQASGPEAPAPASNVVLSESSNAKLLLWQKVANVACERAMRDKINERRTSGVSEVEFAVSPRQGIAGT